MAERELRYEIKMVAQGAARRQFEAHMRLDPAGIRSLYPDRRVQSIYFDDLWQTALEENLAGISHREKIRFRWYGEDARGVRGRLERKVRHNLLGWKDTAEIDKAIDVEGSERHALANAIFEGLEEDWPEAKNRALMPVQWISYARSYWTTADKRIRITIDRDLRTYDLRHRRVITSKFLTRTPEVTIVEAKAAEDAFDELQLLIKGFPLVVDKCSKFVIASSPGEAPGISILT